MGNKIRVNITIDKYVWHELGKYINGSKSAWVESQAKKHIENQDNIEEINMKLQAIEYQEKTLALDKQSLLREREAIIKQREINKNNLKLINEVMDIIKDIVRNQGGIEKKRVEFISNNKGLEPSFILSKLRKEGIKVFDIPIIEDDIIHN